MCVRVRACVRACVRVCVTTEKVKCNNEQEICLEKQMIKYFACLSLSVKIRDEDHQINITAC